MDLTASKIDIQTILREYVGFTVLIIEGVILIVLITNFFVPTYNKIMALRAEIAQKETELSSLSGYANYLVELAGSSLAVEEEIVNYALPSENDVVTLIVTYEGLAKTENLEEVSPISLSPGVLQQETEAVEEGQSGVQQVEFSMEITANDGDAANTIIQEITNTSRIFDILDLTWTVPEVQEGESTESVDLVIDLATYYYIQPVNIPIGQSIVEQGQEQLEFIAQLQQATRFEDLILDGVEVGKEDLMATTSTISAQLQ
ncbi:MAG: hypothetical protein NUV98_03895 [Candidatus Roizmanbacteria bacterium]|nr:hypothetical protein [Candidatus Roizmanbacteria bacterium]